MLISNPAHLLPCSQSSGMSKWRAGQGRAEQGRVGLAKELAEQDRVGQVRVWWGRMD